MIYFLYGPDTYRSHEKLREIISGYRKKYGNFLNFSRFDAEDKNLIDLKIAGKTQSLFSPKQMVVIENIFSSSGEVLDQILKIAEFFKTRPSLKATEGEGGDDILVLWDGMELPSEKLIKKVLEISDKNQEFKKLDRAGIDLWLAKEFQKRGIKAADYKESILACCGGNLWCIKNELDKIEVGGFTASSPKQEKTVFNLSDNFLKNKKEALLCLMNLLKSGEDEFRLFSFIAGHFRNLLKVGSAMRLNKSLNIVTADLKLHPFIVKKAVAEVAGRDENFFRQIFYRIFREDLACKTGESTPSASLIRLLFR